MLHIPLDDTIVNWRVISLTRRQAMYVQRNIEARSCNHYCDGKAI